MPTDFGSEDRHGGGEDGHGAWDASDGDGDVDCDNDTLPERPGVFRQGLAGGPGSNLVDVLERHAVLHPDKTAFVFLADGEKVTASLSYGRLALRARALAAQLQDTCRPGERVLLLYPTSIDYVVGLLACLCAGVIAVPGFVPDDTGRAARLAEMARVGAVSLALAGASAAPHVAAWRRAWPELAEMEVLDADDVPDARAGAWVPLASYDDSMAMLQFTSGRQGTPRPVLISQRNLVYNLEMIQVAFATGPSSTMVNWLPLHRDMGLVGIVLHAFWLGSLCVLMPPAAFHAQPLRWLHAIERFKASFSGAPNAAYELCIAALGTATPRLDLSHWTVAFNGGEPVVYRTVERFVEACAPFGFARRALRPCYWLTEASALVAASPPVVPTSVRRVPPSMLGDDDDLGNDTLESSPPLLVSCGRAMLGERIRIVDPRTRAEVPFGLIGEVWVAGGHVAQGYWQMPTATHAVFDAFIEGTGEGPFLRTGDLGLLDGGELYVTGRLDPAAPVGP